MLMRFTPSGTRARALKSMANEKKHVVLVKGTLLDKLRQKGRLTATKTLVDPLPAAPVSTPPPSRTSTLAATAARGAAAHEKTHARTRLRILYEKLPELPEARKPPCDTCVSGACCYAFLVYLTEDEYKSGVFDDYAIKITPEIKEQLNNNTTLQTMVGVSQVIGKLSTSNYYLEGAIGEPCPFLKKGKCSIYEHRPQVCRVYSCVGDERITEDMRKHTGSEEDLKLKIYENLIKNAKPKQ